MNNKKLKYNNESYMQEYCDFSFSNGMSESKKKRVWIYEFIEDICDYRRTEDSEPEEIYIHCHRCAKREKTKG